MPKPIAQLVPSAHAEAAEAAANLRFSDARWRPIRAILLNAQRRISLWSVDDPTVKKSLEQIADELRTGRSAAFKNYTRGLSKAEKKLCRAIAKNARLLVKQIEMLPRQHVLTESVRRSVDGRDCFAELSKIADRAGVIRRRFPHNVDLARNSAWAQAATVYEQVTGRLIAAAEGSNTDKETGHHRRVPDGPFVRFIQAFMTAIPGETGPTGHQVRQWLRAHWKEASKALKRGRAGAR
jgi:hypothetical protein